MASRASNLVTTLLWELLSGLGIFLGKNLLGHSLLLLRGFLGGWLLLNGGDDEDKETKKKVNNMN